MLSIDIEKVTEIRLGELHEYSDGRFYRELEIKTEKGDSTITLSGDEDALCFKL